MIPQYAQMRRAKYEEPQWFIEPGEVVEAEAIENVNTMLAQGELEETWSEEVKGWGPYTDIVRIHSDRLDQTYQCLVVRE